MTNIEKMNSVSTLTLFRFSTLSDKIWAFFQMQFAHAHISKTPGLQFYKLMGSGKDLGFNPLPDWGYMPYSAYGMMKNMLNNFSNKQLFSNDTKHIAASTGLFL